MARPSGTGSRASHRANSTVVSTKGFDPAHVVALEAELGCKNEHLRNLIRRASAVMAMLEAHGGIIVPHLLDNDESAGQLLRDAIEDARAALGDAA